MLFRDLDFFVYCNSRHFARKVKRGGGRGGGGGVEKNRRELRLRSSVYQSVQLKLSRETSQRKVWNRTTVRTTFFFFSTVVDNWHVTVITARYLSKRVVFVSYLIFSTGRGTIEAVNVVITHSWKMGSRVRRRGGEAFSSHVVSACAKTQTMDSGR